MRHWPADVNGAFLVQEAVLATDEQQRAMIRMAEDLHALREHMESTAKADVEARRRKDVSDGGKALMVLSTMALMLLWYMGVLAASTMLMIEVWVVLVVLAVILGGGKAGRKKAEKDAADDAGAVAKWEEHVTFVRAAADGRQSSKELPARPAQATDNNRPARAQEHRTTMLIPGRSANDGNRPETIRVHSDPPESQ
jgi:hypothetical protein